MKRALFVAVAVPMLLGTAPAQARIVVRPAPLCPSDYWHSHRNAPGTCGWHTAGSLIGRVFKARAAIALCVARRESGLRAWATNGQYRGLFQFGYAWYAGRFNPYNPVANVLRAWTASRYGTNWAPWAWECG